MKTKRPTGKTWKTAKLFKVYLGMKAPAGAAGLRLMWAIVGHKWVRCCTPITNVKFKIRRAMWDELPAGDRDGDFRTHSVTSAELIRTFVRRWRGPGHLHGRFARHPVRSAHVHSSIVQSMR